MSVRTFPEVTPLTVGERIEFGHPPHLVLNTDVAGRTLAILSFYGESRQARSAQEVLDRMVVEGFLREPCRSGGDRQTLWYEAPNCTPGQLKELYLRLDLPQLLEREGVAEIDEPDELGGGCMILIAPLIGLCVLLAGVAVYAM